MLMALTQKARLVILHCTMAIILCAELTIPVNQYLPIINQVGEAEALCTLHNEYNSPSTETSNEHSKKFQLENVIVSSYCQSMV